MFAPADHGRFDVEVSLERQTGRRNHGLLHAGRWRSLQIWPYNVFSRRLIERYRIPNAAVLTLNAANGYMAWVTGLLFLRGGLS